MGAGFVQRNLVPSPRHTVWGIGREKQMLCIQAGALLQHFTVYKSPRLCALSSSTPDNKKVSVLHINNLHVLMSCPWVKYRLEGQAGRRGWAHTCTHEVINLRVHTFPKATHTDGDGVGT